jgi:cytoskeletal protein RodZ
LEEIAARTKIGVKHLEAIEAGEFDKIRGSFFLKSFVRQYAETLGLDWAELEGDLNALLEPEPPQPVLVREASRETRDIPPMPLPGRRPEGPGSAVKHVALSFIVVILVMLGCSAIYSAWERFHQSPAAGKPAIQRPLENPAPPAPPSPIVEPKPPAEAKSNGVEAVAEPRGRQDSQQFDGSLKLSAKEDAWVSVSAGGKTIFIGILKANETKTLNGLETARLLTGNAGGLEISWNGQSIGPVGPHGQVRIVNFSGAGFEVSLPQKAQEKGSSL